MNRSMLSKASATCIEALEQRWLLSSVAMPMVGAVPSGSANPVASAFTPDQIKQIYGIDLIKFGNIVGDGTGQTIAIINAFDNPSLLNTNDPNFANSDLAKFDQQYNL